MRLHSLTLLFAVFPLINSLPLPHSSDKLLEPRWLGYDAPVSSTSRYKITCPLCKKKKKTNVHGEKSSVKATYPGGLW